MNALRGGLLDGRVWSQLADLDGDGVADLVMLWVGLTNWNFQCLLSTRYSTTLSPVPSGLTPNRGRPVVNVTSYLDGLPHPHMVDLDGDSDLDLVVLQPKQGMFYLLNEGGVRSPAYAAPKPLALWADTAVTMTEAVFQGGPVFGDLNGDGVADLLVIDGDGRFSAFFTPPGGGLLARAAAAPPDTNGTVRFLPDCPTDYSSPVLIDVNGDG
jgi:hypothetical protein